MPQLLPGGGAIHCASPAPLSSLARPWLGEIVTERRQQFALPFTQFIPRHLRHLGLRVRHHRLRRQIFLNELMQENSRERFWLEQIQDAVCYALQRF